MERNSKLKRLEYWIKARIGKIAFIKKEINRPKSWYGNGYGGFYIDPTIISDDAIIYSFGIGTDISFDLDIILKHPHTRIFGFDPTPKSIDWISHQTLPENFKFYPFGIGVKTEKVTFNLPKNKDFVSGSIYNHHLVDHTNTVEVQLKSFQDIVHELGHTKIDVLKMDIEGSEYAVMEDILNSGILITQILVETHERFFDNGKEKGEYLFKLMHDKNYKIFAISDTYQEISFIKV